MIWKGMEIPCMIEGTKGIRISSEFTLKAEIKANIIGGIQTIFSKRTPLSTGNRPGIIFTLRGSLIECMMFANNAQAWITARTVRNVIKVGQKFEILVFRAGERLRIYVNGIDRTHPRYGKCSPGDVNSDMDIIIGGQIYDTPELSEPFAGKIYSVEYYDVAHVSAASPLRYPHNPFAFPMAQLPRKIDELKLPIKLAR